VSKISPDRPQASRPASPALRLLSCDELLKLNIPPKRFLLEPWLPERGLAMVYAQRGVGKTLFGLGIAHAVAAGRDFLRFRAPEPRRVVYIDGEMPLQNLQERLAATVAATGQAVGDRLSFLCSDAVEHRLPDLGTKEGQRAIAQLIERADLVIVDNISTLVRTGSENESDSWQPVQDWGLEQRRAGRAVLFVHHTNKAGAQRGTSRREDVLDTVISLARPDDYRPCDGARFILRFEKARGFLGADADPLEAKYEVVDGAARWTIGDLVDERLGEAQRLFDEGHAVREVAKRMGISSSAAGRLRQRVYATAADSEAGTCPAVPGA
jgi:putative DNA primase/helicase